MIILYSNLSPLTLSLASRSQVWIYFAILIVFGAFFAVNLLLAVLYVKFTEGPGPGASR